MRFYRKKYTTTALPRTVKRNRGERAMYYISNSNEAIISQEVFEQAQALRKRRTVTRSEEPKRYSGKIQCRCGSRCRAKLSNQVWYWSCVAHEEQKDACPVKQIPEETINAAFCRLYCKLKHHGGPIFSQMLSISRRSALAGCYGARTLSRSTRKYRTFSVRFNS